MILGIIMIVAGYTWLLYETKFMTIHLPYGKLPQSLAELLPLVFVTIIIIGAFEQMEKKGGL